MLFAGLQAARINSNEEKQLVIRVPVLLQHQQSRTTERLAHQLRAERQLVAQLVAGERTAWIEFVERFQRVVFARVNRVLTQSGIQSNSNDSDDIVAELFASLLANNMKMLRSFEHRSTISTWLTIIAHRMSLRAVTKLKRREHANRDSTLASTGSLADLPGSPLDDPVTNLIGIENRSTIHRKIALLKPADRQVIELFHFQNLGYREIAKRMGLSENSVGSRLTRAQRRLRRLMEDSK